MEVNIKGETIQIDDVFSEDVKKILLQYQAQKARIEKKYLQDLANFKFYIKNYQRGYRWTKTEIEELLTDIHELKDGKRYCLQPLVVTQVLDKEAKCKLGDSDEKNYQLENAYELIDGQQRLTTLWLIKNYLKRADYEIYYELIRGVDKHYIDNAIKTIKLWFEGESFGRGKASIPPKCEDKDAFSNKLNQLFFVWYEVKNGGNGKSEEIFNSVNDGKVPLTNAELFKALLLDENSQLSKEEQVKIAYEWDKIEGNLRDDDFWAFISNDQSDQKTRIDYLLDVYAKKLKDEDTAPPKKKQKNTTTDLDFHKERFSFLMTQRHKTREQLSAKTIWEEIVKVYDKLYSWYKDDELYHTIGFLVASEEKYTGSKATASELVCKFYSDYKDKPLSAVRELIRKEICEKYFGYLKKEGDEKSWSPLSVDDVKYSYDGETSAVEVGTKWLRAILLFSNIYAGYFQVINAKNEESPVIQKFPFKTYKSMKWDIEHIRPKELPKFKPNPTEIELQSARDALEKEEILNEEEKQKIKTDEGLISFWNTYQVTVDHDLSNLVLLDASTNRQYGNAFFCRKREDVIQFDVDGRFIPLCTKRAFLKYYSTGIFKNSACWTTTEDKKDEASTSDKDGYNQYLNEMFDAVQKWRKK